MCDENTNKNLYRSLCEKERSIPIFSQAWWLDAAAGEENWDVVLVVKGGLIEGALPYVVTERFGLTILTMPNLTPALGPWLRPCSGRHHTIIARGKDLLTQLFDALPDYDVYQQNWSVERQNWQPLYWKGFEQTTGYTYRLNDISDTDAIWAAMHQNNRNDIRKARDRNKVSIRAAKSIEEVLDVCNKTFERQNLSVPYSREYVKRIADAAAHQNAIDLLIAEGPDGNLHAGAIIVYGHDVAYYILGGGDPELRNSGAATLILWEAILRSRERVRIFDFEGSMIESIERFFRGFGGELTPYMSLRKANSWRGRTFLFAQDVKKGRRRGKNGEAAR